MWARVRVRVYVYKSVWYRRPNARTPETECCRVAAATTEVLSVALWTATTGVGKKTLQVYNSIIRAAATTMPGDGWWSDSVRGGAAVGRGPGDTARWTRYFGLCAHARVRLLYTTAAASLLPTSETGFPPRSPRLQFSPDPFLRAVYRQDLLRRRRRRCCFTTSGNGIDSHRPATVLVVVVVDDVPVGTENDDLRITSTIVMTFRTRRRACNAVIFRLKSECFRFEEAREKEKNGCVLPYSGASCRGSSDTSPAASFDRTSGFPPRLIPRG